MTRTLFSVAVGFALLSGSLRAADDKGQTVKVKKVDEKTNMLIVTTSDPQVVKDAEPTSEPESMHFPASMRRRYEKVDRFPEAYLVFGDAIASFNPIYGQGMSVAALESEELAAVLQQGSGELLGPRFFRRAAKIVDIPWAISVGNDLRIPETIGPRNIGVNFINWYMSKLHKTAHVDPLAALAFFRVANLLAPPSSVLHPKIAWRVLIGGH